MAEMEFHNNYPDKYSDFIFNITFSKSSSYKNDDLSFEEKEKIFSDFLEKIKVDFIKDYGFDITLFTNIHSRIAWYSWEIDMKEFSKKYPDLLFILYCYPTNPDRIRAGYFENGISQISYPGFPHPQYKDDVLIQKDALVDVPSNAYKMHDMIDHLEN
jgi:hypothetical protein